jgi:hypothetical protein
MQEQATKTELEQILSELLERLAAAIVLTDVNIAAGIALNELRGES